MPPKEKKVVVANDEESEEETDSDIESEESSDVPEDEIPEEAEYDEDGNVLGEDDDEGEDDEQPDEPEASDHEEDNELAVDEAVADIEDDEVVEEKDTGNIDLMNCVIDDNDDDIMVEPSRVPDEERRTIPRLTKFETIRVLGTRTTQLSQGAPPLVKNVENKSPFEIATIELQMKMIPYKIRRPLPNRTYEIWKLKELDL
jgi:DNA-directed RNA polymerase subunit K/omega